MKEVPRVHDTTTLDRFDVSTMTFRHQPMRDAASTG